MSDVLMATAAKAEPDDLSSLYDLEYRANEDDAWYSVYVLLDAKAQTLTVKYLCSPEVYEVVFSAAGFETEAQVEELVARFRPVSQQLQDHQCGKLSVGATVCAAHGTGDDDLRFYDAIVEAINRQGHSFPGGEEECSCIFVLFWQHGRGRGTLTYANIASICIVEPATQIDPRISAFAKMAQEKITSSKSISAFNSLGSASKHNSCVPIEKNLESSQNAPLERETSMTLKSIMWKKEDSGRISNFNQWTSQDEDMGPKHCNTDGLIKADGHYFILISNLEKDLTPSSVKKFIYKQTAILPEAFIFPRQLSDPFARGAIMVDCENNVQTIYEFLDNPKHLVVSSRGRPWVITEKPSTETFGTTVWNLIPPVLVRLDEIKHKRTDEELKVVLSGTESYRRAKQLRDLFIEFVHHETDLCKKLVLEENKILRSCRPASICLSE